MVLPPLLLLNALQQPLLNSLNQFRQLRGFAVRFALVRLSAVARISLSVSSVIPSCQPKELVAKTRVCPVSKAMRTRSEAKRVAIARLDLVLIFVKADSRVAACWIWSFCRRISSSKAAPVADTLKLSDFCLARDFCFEVRPHVQSQLLQGVPAPVRRWCSRRWTARLLHSRGVGE